MNVTNFLFDSVYQIVTWVLIALTIGGIWYFASKDTWRGVMWTSGILLCLVALMICLIADNYFFRRTATSNPTSEIHLVARPLASLKQGATQRLVSLITITNSGDSTAKNVTGEYETALQTTPDINREITDPQPFGPLEIPRGGATRGVKIETQPFDPTTTDAIKNRKAWIFLRVRVKFDGDGGDQVPPLCVVYREDSLGNAVFGDCADLPRVLAAPPRDSETPVILPSVAPTTKKRTHANEQDGENA